MKASIVVLLMISAGVARADTLPVWAMEASVGLQGSKGDAYSARLEQFGYAEGIGMGVQGRYDVAATWRYDRHFELVGNFGSLGSGDYYRGQDTVGTSFDWTSHAMSVLLRAQAPMESEHIVAFIEGGPGVAWATSDLSKGEMAHHHETHTGTALTLAGGLRVMPWRHFGFVVKVGHTWAPVLDNLYGETHDVGGTSFDTGMRVTF